MEKKPKTVYKLIFGEVKYIYIYIYIYGPLSAPAPGSELLGGHGRQAKPSRRSRGSTRCRFWDLRVLGVGGPLVDDRWLYDPISHMLHVCNIYLHLGHFWGKCHTWSIWVWLEHLIEQTEWGLTRDERGFWTLNRLNMCGVHPEKMSSVLRCIVYRNLVWSINGCTFNTWLF